MLPTIHHHCLILQLVSAAPYFSLYTDLLFISMVLMGFTPFDIVLIFSATQIWSILEHTEMMNKLGWVEYIFVTPSHHRVHHASNSLYLDKNIGMLLLVWDRLFVSPHHHSCLHGSRTSRELWGDGGTHRNVLMTSAGCRL